MPAPAPRPEFRVEVCYDMALLEARINYWYSYGYVLNQLKVVPYPSKDGLGAAILVFRIGK